MENNKTELVKKIAKIKVDLQNANLKKSGKNSYAKFKYYELSDFLPTLNNLMNEQGLCDYFTQTSDSFSIHVTDGNSELVTTARYADMSAFSSNIKGIQWLGSEQTYYRRYLYMMMFGITENDAVDAVNNNEPQVPKYQAPKNDALANLQAQLKTTVNQYCESKKNDEVPPKPKDVFATYKITAKSKADEIQNAIASIKYLMEANNE